MTESQLVQHTKLFHDNETRLRDALRASEESSTIGRESLVLLHEQGQSLERINGKLDDVDVNLNRGERVLRSMSFWGRVRNFFTFDRSGKAWVYKPMKETGADDAADKRAPQTTTAATATARATTGASSVEDELLTALMSSVGDLKEIAGDMGDELDRHSNLLDEANAKADRSYKRTKTLTNRTYMMT